MKTLSSLHKNRPWGKELDWGCSNLSLIPGKFLLVIVSIFWLLLSPTYSAIDGVYNISDIGAKPDGETNCAEAIQKAIDLCAGEGGGIVYFPPGQWLTGTVYLADNVTIELENGCTVLGATNLNHYGTPRQLPENEGEHYSTPAVFAGKGLKNIAIRGRGTIDGQGSNFKYEEGIRPQNIFFEECQDVLIEGIRLRNSGRWMQHYRNCDRVTIRDIAVFNHATYNNDGLNIDSCRDVTISGCVIDSDDDAIVLKSLSTKPTENVTISDCIISSHCNSIKMGTESRGGFRNITIANCMIFSPRYSEVINGWQRGLAAIALEIVDGGTLDRISITNITINGVAVPIFMRLGHRARTYEPDQPKPDVGIFRNVVMNNIVATDCSPIGCSITGLRGHRIENVSLSNISLNFDGGGTLEDAGRDIPEKPESYPESIMFGTLPAYGFFCRHVKDLRLHNVRMTTSTPDLRHAVVFDDVEDSVIDSLKVLFAMNATSILRLTNSNIIDIRNCRPPDNTDVFISLHGDQTRNISVYNNNLVQVDRIYDLASEVPESALMMWSTNNVPLSLHIERALYNILKRQQ